MNAVLRYALAPDGDFVSVTVAPSQGLPITHRVDPAEARRFAWSMLNDLDPDGVGDVASPFEHRLGEHERVPHGYQRWAVLVAILHGVNRSVMIAQHLNMPRAPTSTTLSQLRAAGFVRKSAAPIGHASIWSLTDLGEDRAAATVSLLRVIGRAA